MMLRINAVGRISPEMHRLRGTLLAASRDDEPPLACNAAAAGLFEA
jgi:hypothetical protein